MPIARPLLLSCLLLLSSFGLAAERLSIRISGGYTELEGLVDYDAALTPVVWNPFDPDDSLTLPPFQTTVPVQYRADDVSWEATLSYRVRQNLQITGGYVDLGRFVSDPMLVGLGGTILPPILRGFRFGPIGSPRPLDPPPGIDIPVDPPILVGVAPVSATASLDADAWLLALELDHDINDRVDIQLTLSFDLL